MQILSSLKHSIFLRIYTGLLLVCLCVALFALLLVDTINRERIQAYRESMATGIMYLIGTGLEEQPSKIQRQYWLNDVSRRFGNDFRVIPTADIDFTASELKRLESQKTVVRPMSKPEYADVFHPVNSENNVLAVRIEKISEQHGRAVAELVANDLSHYATTEEKKERLSELSQRFAFPLSLQKVADMELDDSQLRRLKRNETLLLLRNSSRSDNSSITIIAPSQIEDTIILIGPISLFKWTPLNLVVSVVLISMFLISLGVYALIFPLERKLQLIQSGVNEVGDGNLDTRVQVVGQDEIAKLAATFNAMTEHIKRLIESQRELTRAVSHELRTPVARIRFAVDMLADTEDGESRIMQRDYIDEDIEALNGLIDEILTYAKLEEGSPKLELVSVDLNELVDQIVRETNGLGKDITVESNLSASNITAIADRRYLHRVLQNLAGNALRYADKKIIISAWVQKGEAFVSVEDDGHGIAEADRDKVFVPFARLDDSRTRASGGYGLGLSIVSRIAFWFNGHMSVDESPELGGARFTMAWPVKPLAQTIAADEITQETEARKLMDNN